MRSFKGAIAINNVGNALIPQGTYHPLRMNLGVVLYHAGSKQDTVVLYERVSTRTKEAIGEAADEGMRLSIIEEMFADLVIFRNLRRGSGEERWIRRGVQEAIFHPPRERRTLFRGRPVRG